MKIKDLILSLIIVTLSCSNMNFSSEAYEINPGTCDYKNNEPLPDNELKSSEKILLTYNEVCSCRDYYGVPHTCYFSPYTDPFNSCFAKCLYEAGN